MYPRLPPQLTLAFFKQRGPAPKAPFFGFIVLNGFLIFLESEIVKMDNKFTIQKVDSAKEIAEEAAAAAATKEEEPNETVLSGKSTRFTVSFFVL